MFIIPPKPLLKFVYNCGKTFIVEPIEELSKIGKRHIGIIDIQGEEAQFLLANDLGEIKVLKETGACIQKKHKMGGQSQNRIQRLRTEAITHYVKKVAEYAHELFLPKGTSKNKIDKIIVSGSNEKMLQFMMYLDVKGQVPVVKTVDYRLILRNEFESLEKGRDDLIRERVKKIIQVETNRLTFDREEKVEEVITCDENYQESNARRITYSKVAQEYGGYIGIRFKGSSTTDTFDEIEDVNDSQEFL